MIPPIPKTMMRLLPILCCSVVLVFATEPVRADWQHKNLPNQPTDFIFGYGSLINTKSRNSTATAPIPAIPVRVLPSFGFIRCWNDRSATEFTALGLRKAKDGESTATINGVLYAVSSEDLPKFDAREKGYVRLEIPGSMIESVSWQRLPEAGKIWVYVPQKENSAPGENLPTPDANYPILQSYVDVVVEGALEYGEDFAKETLETTDCWDKHWLNDRELARRPWVNDPLSGKVDELLSSIPAVDPSFKSRNTSEIYSSRWETEFKSND